MPVTTTQADWVGGVLTFSNGAVNCDDGLQVGGVAMSGTVRAGSYTAVSGDDSAGAATIDTGLTTVTTFIVQIYRSDIPITSDQDITESSGTLTVADGAATYAVTAGDVIKWIAVGS